MVVPDQQTPVAFKELDTEIDLSRTGVGRRPGGGPDAALLAAEHLVDGREDPLVAPDVPAPRDALPEVQEVELDTEQFHRRHLDATQAVLAAGPALGLVEGVVDDLAAFRRRDGKVMFGQNVVHYGQGVLRIGDPIAPAD